MNMKQNKWKSKYKESSSGQPLTTQNFRKLNNTIRCSPQASPTPLDASPIPLYAKPEPQQAIIESGAENQTHIHYQLVYVCSTFREKKKERLQNF